MGGHFATALKDDEVSRWSKPPGGRLTPGLLGRLRSEVKQHLQAEMKEIDAVVERIIA